MGLDRLLEDQNVPPSSPLYWVLGGVFLILLIVALYIWLQGQRRYADDRFHRRLVERYAGLIAGFSALGVSAVAFSLLAVPFLSKRLWLVLAGAGLWLTLGHLGYYVRRRYRPALRAHLEQQRRQRSLPRPKGAGRKRRGKRR